MEYYDEEKYYIEQQELVNNYKNNYKLENISIDDIKLGDKVIISFYPCSQKYMYTLYSKYGTVIKINDSEDDYDIIIQNEQTTYNLLFGNLSPYSAAYDYSIYLLNDK